MTGALAASVGWCALGFYIAFAARDLGIGTAGEPGPGLLAFLLGIVMVVLGGAGVMRAAVGVMASQRAKAAPGSWPWRTMGLAVALVLYITALQALGYPLATALFLAILFLAFAQLHWMKVAALSVVLSGVSYALFKLALGVQLPAGVLG